MLGLLITRELTVNRLQCIPGLNKSALFQIDVKHSHRALSSYLLIRTYTKSQADKSIKTKVLSNFPICFYLCPYINGLDIFTSYPVFKMYFLQKKTHKKISKNILHIVYNYYSQICVVHQSKKENRFQNNVNKRRQFLYRFLLFF